MMTIVIVDDQPVNVKILKQCVSKLTDCTEVSFTSSAEALTWCQHNDLDLLLTDYMMPAPNGTELIRQFRKLSGKEEIPIVMITGESQREVRYEALELGANDFLSKPIDTVEFVARVKNMLALRRSQKKLANHAAWLSEEVRKATASIITRERESIVRLSKAAEYRDPETGSHIVRMAHYCKQVASQIGLPIEEQDLLLAAAPMHDVGKVGIPDAILLKPARLTPDEMFIMRQHTTIGYEILRDSPSRLHQTAAEIAMTHHERFDGTGYPNRIKGQAIPLFGRIVALCDVFDALTSVRPYKKAWSVKDAVAYISDESGKHFDPQLVGSFNACLSTILEIKEYFNEADGTFLPEG
jgi:response regulator RpfG family c-di-GMP phosphodiesterase